MSEPVGPRHKVVIVGGGFGGMLTALGLRKAACDITLVDRRNFHLFQPLLYQVATGGLSPANIASPLRSILRKQKNVELLLGLGAEAVFSIFVSGVSVLMLPGDESFTFSQEWKMAIYSSGNFCLAAL